MKSALITRMIFCVMLSATVEGRSGWMTEKASPVVEPALAALIQTRPDSRVPVWVYFTDKGIYSDEQYAARWRTKSIYVTERAIQRRLKVSFSEGGFDDVPVSEVYILQLESMGFTRRHTSRWFNAVSGFVSPDLINSMAGLEFVHRMTVIHPSQNRPQEKSEKTPQTGRSTEHSVLNYGPSADQLEQLNVPAVHDRGYVGKNVLICVLDTGFWLEHEAVNFINKVAEYDFVFNDDNTANEPGDAGNQDSHGTQVLSVVGGKMDGFLYGPAFGADFLLGKTEDMRGETVIEEDNWVAALEWAEALGADIVTTSLGYIDWYTYKDMDGKTAITSQAAQKAAAKGVLVLVSAGNERDDPWYYITAPADADSIVTVGAVDKYGFITGFSSSGPTFDGRIKPEVVAMGQSVRMASTLCPSCYTSANGTSYATPLVAGVAALLVEAHPFWSPMQLREALINTADRSGQPDNLYGWGLVNALAAIEYRLTGDINDDDRVDRNDALLAADIWLGRHHCSGEALEKADVNGDGDINVLDVVWITRQ